MGLKAAVGAVPVPVSETACGLLPALSVMTSVAERCPDAVGLNTKGIPVEPLGAMVMGAAVVGRTKPVDNPKSPGLPPLRDSPVICNGALPVLVAVTDSVALLLPMACVPNGSGLGLNRVSGAATTPVPASDTVSVVPLVLLMINVALRAPCACGLNATLTGALPPGGTLKERGPLMLKSLALRPASSMPVTFTVVLVLLLIVTGRLAVTLTPWLPKLSEVGLTETPEPVVVPLPDREIVCRLPPLLSAMTKLAARAPAAAGVKVTGMVAEPPLACSVMGAVAVVEKSAALLPENVTAVICTTVVLELDTVTGTGVLLLPIA